MNIYTYTVLALGAALLAPPLSAQTPAPHYQWTAGQKLRFLIQREPYFADPQAALEEAAPGAPYHPPVVERLTETVQAVAPDGTATVRVTLAPEPGFEDDDHPQPPITRTVVVTPKGQVVSISGPKLGSSPAERDLLRGFVPMPPGSVVRPDGLAVQTRTWTLPVTQIKSPGHDGVLTQTTAATQSDHLVFDCRQGQFLREYSTLAVTITLVMNGRGKRGSDDFGHVVPNVQVLQTLTVIAMAD